MNRIEQVATPTPAQQPQPRLPRALADVRRRAAHAMVHPGETTSARARRGTSGVAVALAALAVPLLPSSAFGVASAAGTGAAKPGAPHARHHLHHGQVYPGSGPMTVQAWSASGWTLTVPGHPADMGLLGHVLAMHHDGDFVPWLSEPTGPIQGPRPVVLPDGKRGEIAAYRVSHTSPRADDSGVPESQAPADLGDQTGPNSSMGQPTGQPFGDPAAVRAARNRFVPTPMITSGKPANTKQMMVGTPRVADSPNGGTGRSRVPQQAMATADPESPCVREPNLAGQDNHMLAHLRPAADVMNVVVTRPRAACAARVDYLSQVRA